jgi:hypothetical protein
MITTTIRYVKTFIQSLPSNLLFFLRCLVVVFVWGVCLPILLAETWNYIMGAEPYPWFVDESTHSWLPLQLNPLRLLLSACKGIFIFSGLFIGSGIMFLSMEQIEAYLEHVTFMRNHRRNRQLNPTAQAPLPPQALIPVHEAPEAPQPDALEADEEQDIRLNEIDAQLTASEVLDSSYDSNSFAFTFKPNASWLEILRELRQQIPLLSDHLLYWNPEHRLYMTTLLENDTLRAKLESFVVQESQKISIKSFPFLDVLLQSHWQVHRAYSLKQAIRDDEASLTQYYNAFITMCHEELHLLLSSPHLNQEAKPATLDLENPYSVPKTPSNETFTSDTFTFDSGRSLRHLVKIAILSEALLQMAIQPLAKETKSEALMDKTLRMADFQPSQLKDPLTFLKASWHQMVDEGYPCGEFSHAISAALGGNQESGISDLNPATVEDVPTLLLILTSPSYSRQIWLEKKQTQSLSSLLPETGIEKDPSGEWRDQVLVLEALSDQLEQEGPEEAEEENNEENVLEEPAEVEPIAVREEAQIDDEIREEEAFLQEFGEEDDEDSEVLQQHWLLAIFGRRDRDRDQNENQAANAQQDEVPFTDMIGLSGNMLWIIVAVIMVLVFGTLEITFAILIPQLVGKLFTLAQSSVLGQLEPWWQSLVITVPNLAETAFWLRSFLNELAAYSPELSQVLVEGFHSLAAHPLTQLAIQPTCIGYLVCAVLILLFSAKRSPLAILIRAIIAHLLEFVVIPAMLGNMVIQFASTICRFEDEIYRIPYTSRLRMQRHVSKLVYGGSGARWAFLEALFPGDRPAEAGFGTVAHVLNQTLTHIAQEALHLNATAPSVLEPLVATSESSLANLASNVTSTVAAAAAANAATESSTAASSTMLETAILHFVTQIENGLSYFYTRYLELLIHLFVGYLVLIAWVAVLKTIRNALKPGIITFLKFHGDGDFSFFLFLANNSMTAILARIAVTLVFNAIGISLLIGIPTAIVKWLIASGFSSLYRISVPTSAFQSFTDTNIGITFTPISILLIKPIKTTGAFIRFVTRFLARIFDIEAQILPDHAVRAGQVAQAGQNGPPAQNGPNAAPAVPNGAPAVQNGNQGDIARENGVEAVAAAEPRWLGLRKIGAAILGMSFLAGAVLFCLTVPWMVGTWVYHIWMPESEAYPVNTFALGAYFVVLAVRIALVYVNIYRTHRAVAAAILDDDEEAKGVLARTTFDNAFRATVILLAMLLIIPVILGYLVRVILSNSVLPANVMVTIHSPLNEYAYGLIFMRFLDALTKWPIPWFVPVRQVLDTLSFEGIIQVDYTAFLNHLVYPLASSAFLLLGAPTIANVVAYFYLPEMPDDQFVNFKRKSFILLPLALIWLIILYYWLSSAFRAIDHFLNGKVVVGRQIHNLEVPAAAVPEAQAPHTTVQQQNPNPLLHPLPADPPLLEDPNLPAQNPLNPQPNDPQEIPPLEPLE